MSGVVQKQVLFNRILQGVEYRLRNKQTSMTLLLIATLVKMVDSQVLFIDHSFMKLN